jgi:riboflavin biosynthesis pyrimidine reductase
VYLGSIVIGGKESPTMADGAGAQRIEEIVNLELKSYEKLGEGLLLRYNVKK